MASYDLELSRAAEHIRLKGAKTVCIQLPEGLKPEATQICDYLEEKTGATVLIWAASCFGACDVPELPVDLLIQWGHTPWL